VLDIESLVRDRAGARRAPAFTGQIEFDKVSFGYGAGTRILKHVSFTVEAGQVAGIVGPAGSWKTTSLSVIPRFYDPACPAGCSSRGRHSLSCRTRFSPRATIWESIAYGKPGAPSREIKRAADLAHASDFIEGMPDGYDKMVGERGVTLRAVSVTASRLRTRCAWP